MLAVGIVWRVEIESIQIESAMIERETAVQRLEDADLLALWSCLIRHEGGR
jgi:hypothetical protein